MQTGQSKVYCIGIECFSVLLKKLLEINRLYKNSQQSSRKLLKNQENRKWTQNEERLIWGGSHSYMKGHKEKDAGQIIFQLFTPTLRKMSDYH